MEDLVINASTTQTTIAGKSGQFDDVWLTLSLTDTRPYAFSKKVKVIIDWGDGAIVSYDNQASPCLLNVNHSYDPGSYLLKIVGTNYELPVPEVVVLTLDVKVSGANSLPVTAESLGFQPVVFGPILPRSDGFPNPDQWAFQTAEDSVLLESSARMLLITSTGERLMELDYGTNIRGKIFSASDSSVQDAVTQDIIQSFSKNEPRLVVSKVTVTGIGTRQVQIMLILKSTIDQHFFSVTSLFSNS